MTGGEFQISGEELRQGIMPSVAELLGQSEAYTSITPAVSEQVKEGRFGALFIPAVKFIVDATLGVVAQPGVQERLPSEVIERYRAARYVGGGVTMTAINLGIFMSFYAENADLREFAAHAAVTVANTSDFEALEILGLAPFSDASVVSGGSLQLLREKKIDGDSPADIIGRSTGLLAVSGISIENGKAALDYLCKPGTPYASTEHLKPVPGKTAPEITFTDDSFTFLKTIMGDGCPSRHLAVVGNPELSVLENAWRQIVGFLVPPDATVSQYASLSA